jgi:hypothetical protein
MRYRDTSDRKSWGKGCRICACATGYQFHRWRCKSPKTPMIPSFRSLQSQRHIIFFIGKHVDLSCKINKCSRKLWIAQ